MYYHAQPTSGQEHTLLPFTVGHSWVFIPFLDPSWSLDDSYQRRCLHRA